MSLRRSRALASLLPLWAGCASIHPEFDAAREVALADPGPLPEDWRPDAVVRLSAPLVDDLVAAVVRENGSLTSQLAAGPMTLTPALRVDALKVRGGRACDDCLGMQAALSGSVAWTSPLGDGTRAFSASADLDAVFAAAPDDEGVWTVTARPRRVRDVTVELGGVQAGLSGVSEAVRPWIDSALTAVPATPIATLGSTDLPVRGVRVAPDRRTVQLQVRTTAATDAVVPADGPRPQQGFTVTVAPDTVLALARRVSFEAGPVAYDVTPEPTALNVDGERFELGLRLWRTTGRGWWRDVEVSGDLAVEDDALALQPDDAVEVAQSRGAVWVDPIAALVEGALLRGVSEALDTALPTRHRDEVAGLRTVLSLDEVVGVDGALRASGTLRVRDGGRGRRR